mgnify:CR=1 FL=1
MINRHCLDTYALWEIHLGNEKYHFFSDEEGFVISNWTLIEFYRTLLRQFNQQTADYWLKKLKPFCEEVDLDILAHAAVFQHEHHKKRISLFDAVGYCFSQSKGYTFVTGDKEFEQFKGVLFIKK